jgi:23S rRNA pseudouridine1911/1915/1917 synthase
MLLLAMMTGDGEENESKPLVDWVLQNFPDTPKTRAKQWIVSGRVRVDGMVIRKPQQVIPDPQDTLHLLDRHSTNLECSEAWQIHPRVALVYLDSSFAVLNKGPGLISVPAPNCELSALSILSDFLAGRLKPQDRDVTGRSLPATYRRLHPLPVHRLDQYTSGLFCTALNPNARQRLIEQLSSHAMKRQYIAFVDGRPQTSKGTWRQWLQLSEDEMRQHVVSEPEAKAGRSKAVEAITHFEVIAEFPLAAGKGVVTKLRLRLETGRKHQIRVQAAHAGLPLIGDRTYHPGYRAKVIAVGRIEFPRQALHSEKLTLEHPEQPERLMNWTVELPKDLRQLEAALRSLSR